jgi:hypothetical protein
MPPRPPTKEDIEANIEVNDRGCWIWLGPHLTEGKNGGYPYWKGRRSLVIHREAYKLWIGPIPTDADGKTLDLDHRCNDKLCVNPYHRLPMTRAENTRQAYREKHRQMPWKTLRVARDLHNRVGDPSPYRDDA